MGRSVALAGLLCFAQIGAACAQTSHRARPTPHPASPTPVIPQTPSTPPPGTAPPAPSTALPPSTPIGPTTCGPFGDLPLVGAVPLLDDRVRIRPLRGMRNEARGHDIMAADGATTAETRLVIGAHHRKLVVFTTELGARAPRDLEKAARASLADLLSQPASALTPVSVDAMGLTVAAFVPGPPQAGSDGVPVLAAIVVPPDHHPIAVRFYVTPNIAAPGCTELARKLTASMTAGTRPLDVSARDMTLSDLVEAHVPVGWTYSMRRGPDFDVHGFQRVDELGTTGVTSIGIYVGFYPETPPTPTRTIPGQFLDKAVQWGVTSDHGSVNAQVVVHPRGPLAVHVWAVGPNEASMQAARAIAETFTLAPVTRTP